MKKILVILLLGTGFSLSAMEERPSEAAMARMQVIGAMARQGWLEGQQESRSFQAASQVQKTSFFRFQNSFYGYKRVH